MGEKNEKLWTCTTTSEPCNSGDLNSPGWMGGISIAGLPDIIRGSMYDCIMSHLGSKPMEAKCWGWGCMGWYRGRCGGGGTVAPDGWEGTAWGRTPCCCCCHCCCFICSWKSRVPQLESLVPYETLIWPIKSEIIGHLE